MVTGPPTLRNPWRRRSYTTRDVADTLKLFDVMVRLQDEMSNGDVTTQNAANAPPFTPPLLPVKSHIPCVFIEICRLSPPTSPIAYAVHCGPSQVMLMLL